MENSAFCPHCAEKFIIKHDSNFELGKQVTCKNCETKFNIFEIYKNIYDEIAVGKKIVEIATDIIFSKFVIEGDPEFETLKIAEVMKEKFSDDDLKKIISHCLIFGTCVLQINKKEFSWKLIHLPDYEIEIGHETKGGQALFQVVKGLKNHNTNERIPREQLAILFTESSHSNDDIGFSIYGMWFRIWAILKIGPASIANTKSLGKKDISLRLSEIFQNYQNQMLNTISVVRMSGGKFERDTLGSRIGKEIFPFIAEQPKRTLSERLESDKKEPRLKFTKDLEDKN